MKEVALRSLNVGGVSSSVALIRVPADVVLSPEDKEGIAQWLEERIGQDVRDKKLAARSTIQLHLESISGILVPRNISGINGQVVMGFVR